MVCTLLTLYGMLLYRRSRAVDTLLLVPEREKEEAQFFLWLKDKGIIQCRIFTVKAPELINEIEKNAAEIIMRAYSPGDDRSGKS